jgi:hypothetical protein
VGGNYSPNIAYENCGDFLVITLKEDLDINRKLILKLTLNNYSMEWIHLAQSSQVVDPCEHGNGSSVFINKIS